MLCPYLLYGTGLLLSVAPSFFRADFAQSETLLRLAKCPIIFTDSCDIYTIINVVYFHKI